MVAAKQRTIVPTFDKFMWPTLQALRALGGSAKIGELDTKVTELMRLTPQQTAEQHAGRTRTEAAYRMGWARTWLGKFGAIENSERGVWTLSKKGEGLTEVDILRVVPEVRAAYATLKSASAEKEETAVSESSDAWQDQLLSILKQLKPDQFERLCQRVLREQGFENVEVTGRSGDGGIDGLGILSMSLLSFKVVFQCKRWERNVPAEVVRDFRGAMQGRAEKGLILTTAGFTPAATAEASREGAPVIDLVDGSRLCDILNELGFGTRKEPRVTVNESWFADI